jgi:adenosyl cobinamide kinase/adenosyl cobinamide phosphate guanylyltransferase
MSAPSQIPGSTAAWPLVTLVLGGARSGKSRHAELLLTRHAPPWTYIATARDFDDEMHDRIAEHRARRGAGWQTIEAPADLPAALVQAARTPVLIDCLTLWLSNLMLDGHNVETATVALTDALRQRDAPTILVSNEVGLGIVPVTPLGRTFRDAAGHLNQRVAASAGGVILMVAGLPLTVK